MEEHHITVPRTARYHTLGDPQTTQAIWIVLHGYGQLARYFLRNFEGLANEVLIAAPEGLSRYYTDDEHVRVGATWMTREDRGSEITDQHVYLDTLADHLQTLIERPAPIRVLGFSQGVATAARWASLGRTRMDRLVLWGGSMPPDISASTLRARWNTVRVQLVHGEQDTVVPEPQLTQAEARFREAGVSVQTLRHAGGHALDKLLLQRLFTA